MVRISVVIESVRAWWCECDVLRERVMGGYVGIEVYWWLWGSLARESEICYNVGRARQTDRKGDRQCT